MKVTVKQVKELVKLTEAGVVICRKALQESEGDMEKAVDYIRRWMDRMPKPDCGPHGLCLTASEGNRTAVFMEVNCMTGPVERSAVFRTFASRAVQQALHSDADDLESFLDETWLDDRAGTVRQTLDALTGAFGETVSIFRFKKIITDDSVLATYVHEDGRIAVILEAEAGAVNDAVAEALQNVAIQIAALSPRYVSVDEISGEYRAREKEILLDYFLEGNEMLPEDRRKSRESIEEMATGRLQKQLMEICLNDQIYIKAEDGRQTVAGYLKEVGRENGTVITIRRFFRFYLGEGRKYPRIL